MTSQRTSDPVQAAGAGRTENRDGRRVIYVSYDGAAEPLGRSQVLSYLLRLAPVREIALVSFEKPADRLDELARELFAAGIEWLPHRYHRRPPVLSTALDVLSASKELIRTTRRRPPAIIHARSYVPALMALLARPVTDGLLVFDLRGFWIDERVESGLMRPGGLVHRVARRCERWFYREADAIVTQTEASLPRVRRLAGERDVLIAVIPNCVDLARFGRRPERPGGPHTVWIGSIGTWYRFDLAARVARALEQPFTVITRQVEAARRELKGHPATVCSVAPKEMPAELFAGDIGLCLVQSAPSKAASAPTRFAEYLSAGMPVITTPEIGDLESIVEEYGVGVVLRGEDDRSIAAAGARARELAADPAVRQRCRQVACERFDADRGAAQYAALYRSLES